MPDVRAAVDRMLARFHTPGSPDIDRLVAAAEAGPRAWLPSAAELLRASWNGGGRAPAAAAAALLELALDTGPREYQDRARWVLHLWLAEHTLSALYGDYRLSQEVRHYLASQTQNRRQSDPVAVAAVYPDLPPPPHFAPALPIEQEVSRLVDTLPSDDLGRPTLLALLARAAYQRYESGDTPELAVAWARAREALESVAPDHIDAATIGRTAAYAGIAWFRLHLKDPSAVDVSVRGGRLALAAVQRARGQGAPYDSYETATVHFTLAIALMAQSARKPDEKTVDEAIAHLEAFRAEGPPDDGGMYALNMASLLGERAFLRGAPDDLAQSTALWGALENDLPADHPLLPHIAQKRAAAVELERMMRATPFMSGLVRRLRLLTGLVLSELPPLQMNAPPAPPGYRSPGGGVQPQRGTMTEGHGATAAQGAMTWPPGPHAGPDPTPGDAPGRTAAAGPHELRELPTDAAAVYRSLTEADSTPLDPRRLVLAEQQLRDRLAQPGLDSGARGWTASVLVHIVAAGFSLRQDPAELERAIRTGDEVLGTLPRTSSRYVELLNTVEQYRHMFGALHRDPATVQRASDALRWTMERAPEGSLEWVGCAVNYGHALSDLAGLLRDAARSAEAVRILSEASACLDALPDSYGGPDFAARRGQLRQAIGTIARSVATTDAYTRADNEAFVAAEGHWDPAAEQMLPPMARFENARSALGRAMESHAWDDATDAVAVALDVLPLLTSRALDRGDRQTALRDALLGRRYLTTTAQSGAAGLPDQVAGTSLARTGCAVALAAGRTEQALALLEQGRAVLMTQDLEARSDISDLAAAHPAAAARFTALSEQMLLAEDTGAQGAAAQVREQHELAREWRVLLADIRSYPGYERFLLPPTAAQLRAEAVQGPIAMINVDRLRCDALVVTSEGVRHVPLDVTEGQLADAARDFFAATDLDRGASRERHEQAREVVFHTLEWLWDRVAEPVLTAAGLTRPIPEGTPRHALPRLWWSASGPLAHLPLHAAGYQRKDQLAQRRSVLDRAASSYTPTIRALRHARQAAVSDGGAGTSLAVAQPTGSGGASGASARETAAVARVLTGLRVLDGADATPARVLGELPAAALVHFACHGVSDADNPLASHLRLTGGTLDVTEVSRQLLPHAQLAVLLACHTARTDRLPDEAIHLASAFQVAGYPQVVGALWEAVDFASARLADRFYRSIRGYGSGVDVTDAGRALHMIVRDLRARYVKSPTVWAPYVHTGR